METEDIKIADTNHTWKINIKDQAGTSISVEISESGVFKIINSDRDIPLAELTKLWEMPRLAMATYTYVQCTKV